MSDLITDDGREYDHKPIVARPVESWRERRYTGRLNIYSHTIPSLTIEIPVPPKGHYTYTVDIVRGEAPQ